MSNSSNQRTSQSQQKGPEDGPSIPGFESVREAAAGGAARLEGLLAEIARMEEASAARARAASEDLARLMASSMTCGMELAAEWRRLALDMARRTTGWMGVRA